MGACVCLRARAQEREREREREIVQLYKEQTVHGLRPWGTRGSRGAPLGPQPYFFVGRMDRTSDGAGSRYDGFLAGVQGAG